MRLQFSYQFAILTSRLQHLLTWLCMDYISLSQAMVLAGKLSQLKWRDLLKASRWSKRRRSALVTRSHSHSTSDGSEIQVRRCHVLDGISYAGYPPPASSVEVSYKILRYHCVRSRTWIGTHTRPITSEPCTQTLLRARPHKTDGNMCPSVTGIEHYRIVQNPT